MKKGFTLLELLIVIGILAILATIVVVVLNPAEYLAQARDTQRLADLDAVRTAVAVYLSTASTTTFLNSGSYYCSFHSGTAFDSRTCTYVGAATTSVTGTGWVRVNLTDAQGGSPIAALPMDPVNSPTNLYAYTGDDTNKVFELCTNLESTKYSPKEATDGGDSATLYEIGTDPALDLF